VQHLTDDDFRDGHRYYTKEAHLEELADEAIDKLVEFWRAMPPGLGGEIEILGLGGAIGDVAEDVELADSVSLAMLLVLETLTPAERAVFVLREVFAFGYEEIAEAVGKSPAAVRQIAHRAREHVAARRPRVPVSQ